MTFLCVLLSVCFARCFAIEGAARPSEFAEALPVEELLLEVHVIVAGEKLTELPPRRCGVSVFAVGRLSLASRVAALEVLIRNGTSLTG